MVEITRQPIDCEQVLAQVADPAGGGVVVFIGRVRNHADGKAVLRMEYEGYAEMARREMAKIEQTVREKWPVLSMTMVHRLGMLEIGEASVVIAVTCAHREQAFAACKFAIDKLKTTVPIWKKEYGPDGASWVDGVVPAVNNNEEEIDR